MAASTSNSNSGSPSLTLPASEQVTADGTIAVSGSYTDNFAQSNPGALYLGISDDDGSLLGFYPASGGGATTAAAGSGSDAITFQGSYADVEAIINSLTYVAAGAGGADDIHYDIWNQAGVETTGAVPVTVSGSITSTGSTTTSSGPSLSEPSSETVPAGATQAVSGSYSDSFAASNSGAMYLGISDSSGTLRATDAAGNPVAGSGSDSISLNTDYTDVNAILKSLTYTASSSGGSDSIKFDIWNQAGVETTGSVPVSITSGGMTETWTGAVSSDWNTAGNWSGGSVPTSGDTVYIYGNAPNNATLSNATLSGETVILQGSGNSSPVVDFNNVTLDSLLESGNAGEVQIGGTLTVGGQGTIDAEANSTLALTGTAETIVNHGLIETLGGDLPIHNGPSGSAITSNLINTGNILIEGGYLSIDSNSAYGAAPPTMNLVNSGSVAISDNGELSLNGSVVGGAIGFDGTGGILLEQGMAFAGGAVVTGFGQGDQFELLGTPSGQGGTPSVNNGTLDITSNGTLNQSIPLNESIGVGNFEEHFVGGPGNAEQFVYAASGQPSGIVEPDIAAPAATSVAQDGTLSLNDVSIENAGTSGADLTITAGSGTLYDNGVSGSGTGRLSFGPTSTAQLNSDLANVSYVPAAGATSDSIELSVSPPAPVETSRIIAVNVTSGGGGGGGPTLNEPSSENVAAGGSIAVSGSYSDSFAAGNPGMLFIGISDSTGTLTATNASGQAVAGSGSNSIALQTDYVDVNAILASLHYAAGASSGSDTINFDIWNQAGVETTASTAVTVGGSSMTMADFVAPTPSTVTPTSTSSGTSGSMLLDDPAPQPIVMPLTTS